MLLLILTSHHILSGLPSPPQSPNTSTVQVGPDNITVVVQWCYPQSDGGAPVLNYTVTLVGSGQGPVHVSITTTVQPVATFTLAYLEYTVSIAATNCAGTGGAVLLNISDAGKHMYCVCNVGLSPYELLKQCYNK